MVKPSNQVNNMPNTPPPEIIEALEKSPPIDDQVEAMSDTDMKLAILDELSGIRIALVSALQLICSVPPFKGAIGVNDDGELFPLNREQRRAAKW